MINIFDLWYQHMIAGAGYEFNESGKQIQIRNFINETNISAQ